MSKIILITGATSGFGKAIAEKFASAKWKCIIAGRKKDVLLEVASSLKTTYNAEVISLVMDVQNKTDVFQQINNLPVDWKQIDVLVNNAGLALGRDSFDEALLDDWDTMIDTNVKGLLYVSKAVLPYMINRNGGHIINIGSTAGIEVYKDGNIYCASKYAVNAISQAQRIDLLAHKIKVTVINPGAAETAFSNIRFKGDQQKAAAVYTGYEPLHAEDIADTVFYCATLPPHVCINELVITCTAQANSYYTHKDQ